MRIVKCVSCAAAILFASCLSAQKATRPPITGLSHLCVYSTDNAKTERFYIHDLGAVKRTDPENAAGARYYFNAKQFIEVLPLPTGYTSINRLDHMGFDTSDVQNLRLYLKQEGIAVPDRVEEGTDGSRWFDITDPEGNKVEFVQPPAAAMPVAVNPLSSHIIHIGFFTHDSDTENKLFRDVLGFRPYWFGGGDDGFISWRQLQVSDGADWIEYMLTKDSGKSGFPAAMTGKGLGVLDHFALGVLNIEETVTVLTGGERLSGAWPGEVGRPTIGKDGKWQFNLFDPDGIRTELMEFKPVIKPCCSEFTASHPDPPVN